MKKIYLTSFLCIYIINIYAQRSHSVCIRDGVDTTNTTFKEILHFWQDYQNDLLKAYKDTTIDTKKYWVDSEIENYKTPDLYLSFAPYHMLSEYLLGIEKRNDTLYEIKSVYYSVYPPQKKDINTIFSILVVQTAKGYKLYNKFTSNKTQLHRKDVGWIQFYYSNQYTFNNQEAKKTYSKVNQFAIELGLKKISPVKYYLCPTYSDMLNMFGINIVVDDFISTNKIRKRGWALHDSRQILYTQGGEQLIHEIIHILIYDIRQSNKEINFDEGICCYFGDHQGFLFPFHAKRLKEFLNQNQQIDLSINLTGAYLDNNQKYTHNSTGEESQYEIMWYCDDTTNYMYIIMGVICEIAYKKGGMKLVKQMIIEAKNGDEMYSVIEKNIDIQRKDINTCIRTYINNNF